MLKKKLLSDEALLFLIFLTTIIIVNPLGNFPLNDDWAYFYSVKTLLEEGIIKISDWASPSLIFQIIVGALFCKIFPLSYTTLRILTLIFSFSGSFFFLLLLKKLKVKKSVFFATTLLFNPFYFVLSFTFMTEIYYISLFIISVYFYFLGYKENKIFYTIIGSIFASFSILVRQIGIFIPFSFFLFYLLKNKKIKIETFIIPLIVFILYSYWFKYIHHSNWAHEVYLKKLTIKHYRNLFNVLFVFFWRLINIVPVLFSFVFPITLSLKQKKEKKTNILFYVLAIIIIIFYINKELFLGNPSSGNYLHRYGLGVITLGGEKRSGFFKESLFFILLILSLFSLKKFLNIKPDEEQIFVSLPFILQSLFMLTGVRFFDRYLITFIPAILILFSKNEIKEKYFKILIIPLILFSTFLTEDYLSWNRAKLRLGKKLIEKGIKPEEISAGFDWDGHFIYHRWMEKTKKYIPLNQIGEWDWQKRKIKFSLIFGEGGIFKEKYFSFLNFKNNYVSAYPVR